MTAIRDFESYEAATAYLASLGPGNHGLVGRYPMASAVPIEPLRALRPVYRTPAPGLFGTGAVQVFELSH